MSSSLRGQVGQRDGFLKGPFKPSQDAAGIEEKRQEIPSLHIMARDPERSNSVPCSGRAGGELTGHPSSCQAFPRTNLSPFLPHTHYQRKVKLGSGQGQGAFLPERRVTCF